MAVWKIRLPEMTLQHIKTDLIDAFRAAGIETPYLDARFIIMSVAGVSQADMIARADQVLPKDIAAKINACKDRRLSGEPLDSVLGYSEFYGRRFKISEHVLSPRPETEHVVDTALARLKSLKAPHILDLGVGSGAILVTLLAEIYAATGIGVDISSEALDVAKANAKAHNVQDRVSWLKGSWFKPVEGRFDLIVSNPPYITDAAISELAPEVSDFDPDIALRGGADGLEAYRSIISNAPQYIKQGGYLVFEIGFDQGEAVKSLMLDAGFDDVMVEKDLSGHDRVVSGRLS